MGSGRSLSNGHRTLAVKINYKELRKISPATACQAVVDYSQNDGGNITEVARIFGINRCVVYDILHKWSEGDLRDRPRTPLHQPHRTPAEREDQVIAAKNQTRLGPERLSRYVHLAQSAGPQPVTGESLLSTYPAS
jgi:transposase-like protein